MNDSMGEYVANQVIKLMLKKQIKIWNADIVVLGFTFKENCPDVRNTKVIDIVNTLKSYDVRIDIYDPWIDPNVTKIEYGLDIMTEKPQRQYDAVILAVPHEDFKEIDLISLVKEIYVIYDVKNFLDNNIIDGRL
jgi:UDP-N-acetyl-D-galactosamine dehydrogenase